MTASLALSITACSSLPPLGGSMGGWTTIRTPLGMATTSPPRPGGWYKCVPIIVIGTTRRPARPAIVKAPFLNEAIRPSLERVP